jgi:hypothetical protein
MRVLADGHQRHSRVGHDDGACQPAPNGMRTARVPSGPCAEEPSPSWDTPGPRFAVRRRKGGTYPLSHLYGYFGLVRLCRLGHDVPWVKA